MRLLAFALPALFLAACGTSGACEEEAFSCDGTVLYQCLDGVEVEQEDCADVGMECHAEMGHCMDMSDSGM